LILLPTVLNSEAKARPFGEKKAAYARHNLRMVGEVAAQEDWGFPMIAEREGHIVAWAKTRWDDI
jgi:hypothetical protein